MGGIEVGDLYPPRIMAIINLSKDSFYSSSVYDDEKKLIDYLHELSKQKPDFIDVGGISSAPSFLYGEREANKKREFENIKRFLEAYKESQLSIPVSIDTSDLTVAEFALNNGATIINDIYGLKKNDIAKVISDHGASSIIMACKSIPGDVYEIDTIKNELKVSVDIALEAGIEKTSISLDPGLGGWVKDRGTINDYIIIKQLDKIKQLGFPVLIGISRKSFIGKIVNKPPNGRLYGSLAATVISILNGGNIIRTHDIEPIRDLINIMEFYKEV